MAKYLTYICLKTQTANLGWGRLPSPIQDVQLTFSANKQTKKIEKKILKNRFSGSEKNRFQKRAWLTTFPCVYNR